MRTLVMLTVAGILIVMECQRFVKNRLKQEEARYQRDRRNNFKLH